MYPRVYIPMVLYTQGCIFWDTSLHTNLCSQSSSLLIVPNLLPWQYFQRRLLLCLASQEVIFPQSYIPLYSQYAISPMPYMPRILCSHGPKLLEIPRDIFPVVPRPYIIKDTCCSQTLIFSKLYPWSYIPNILY